MPTFRPMTPFEELSAGEFWFEATLALGVIATGAIQGCRFAMDSPPKTALAVASICVSVITGTALLVRAKKRNSKALKTGGPDSLDAILYTLHALLAEHSKACDKEGLRICVFVPGTYDGEAHQICNYIGHTNGTGRGRDMSCRCGVVGKAFRSGKAEYARLPNNSNLVDYLVNDHSFDRGEAVAMRQDARSWAAIPVGCPGRVVAVIFADSSAPDFFGKGNSQKRKILESSTIGVAKFIERN